MKKNETLCLNGLKGLGAFVIAFFWHYKHFPLHDGFPMFSIFTLLYKHGYLMVEIFFMLSGFGMMCGYSDKILKHKISFKSYILKRLKKFYPIFFFTLLLTTIFELIYTHIYGETFIYPNFDLYHFILNVFCVQNGVFGTDWSFDSPSWCISLCILMYCIFYYVVYTSKNENQIFYKSLVIISCTYIFSKEISIINTLLFRGLMCFFIGVILQIIYEKRQNFNYKFIGVISFVFVVFSTVLIRIYGAGVAGNLQLFVILGFGPLLIFSVLTVKFLNKFLSLKPFLFLGNISISIYLFHFPIQCLFRIVDHYLNLNLNYSTKYVWASYVFITLLIAFLYNKFFSEKYNSLFFKILNRKESNI